LKITGLTANLGSLIHIPERHLMECSNKNSIDNFFPEITNERVLSSLKENGGGVLRLRQELFTSEVEVSEAAKQSEDRLVWVKMVPELYGGRDSVCLFLLSPLIEDARENYVSMVAVLNR
jgi:hypothetical protein